MPISAVEGQIIDERFRLLSRIGEGGFGTVYVAEQLGFDRNVIIKFLRYELSQDTQSLARFEREARVIADFKHKNIVSCYTYGVWSGRVPYLVFELLEGRTLRQLMQDGPIDWRRMFSVGADVCSALACAHKAGVVHRDVKPENIFITKDGVTKLLDFGLAYVPDQHLTKTGTVVGTASYISPEQVFGKGLTGRSDIYALGCVLYEGIAGHKVFTGDNYESCLHFHCYEYPPKISSLLNIPSVVDDVLCEAMEKNPADRYDDANAFAADLIAVARAEFPRPLAQSSHPSAQRVQSRPPASLGKLALLVAGIVSCVALTMLACLMSEQVLSTVLIAIGTCNHKETRAARFEMLGDAAEKCHRLLAAENCYRAAADCDIVCCDNAFANLRRLEKLTQSARRNNDPAAVEHAIANLSLVNATLKDFKKTTSSFTRDHAELFCTCLTTDENFSDLSRLRSTNLLETERLLEDYLLDAKFYDLWIDRGIARRKIFEPDLYPHAGDVLGAVLALESQNQFKWIDELLRKESHSLDVRIPEQLSLIKLYTAMRQRNLNIKSNLECSSSVTTFFPLLASDVVSERERLSMLDQIYHVIAAAPENRRYFEMLAPLYKPLAAVRSSPNYVEEEESANHFLFLQACHELANHQRTKCLQMCLSVEKCTMNPVLFRIAAHLAIASACDRRYVDWDNEHQMPRNKAETMKALQLLADQLNTRQDMNDASLARVYDLELWVGDLRQRITAMKMMIRMMKPDSVIGGCTAGFASVIDDLDSNGQRADAIELANLCLEKLSICGVSDTANWPLLVQLCKMHREHGDSEWLPLARRIADQTDQTKDGRNAAKWAADLVKAATGSSK